jgi:hypothetical protein
MKKIILIILIFLVSILLLLFFAHKFSPGSYVHAEEYVINVNESDLIKVIQNFKKDNPQYIVPEQTQLIDGRRNETGQNHWYHVYFYNQDENKIVKCRTRPIEKGKTTFVFIGINDGLALGNWKMINKDFNRSQNKEEKKKFEEYILNRIKKALD